MFYAVTATAQHSLWLSSPQLWLCLLGLILFVFPVPCLTCETQLGLAVVEKTHTNRGKKSKKRMIRHFSSFSLIMKLGHDEVALLLAPSCQAAKVSCLTVRHESLSAEFLCLPLYGYNNASRYLYSRVS